MAIDVGDIVATLKGDTKQFDQAMQKSDAQIMALGTASVAMGNIATQAFNFMAAGVVSASSMLHRWAAEAGEAAERTQLLSMKLGIGEATLEGWSASLKRVGLDQDALAGGMKTLSKQLEGLASGSEKSVELFQKLAPELTAVEAAGLDTEQAIRLIADKFAGMSDGAEKAVLAQQALGRAGLQLLPVLNQGSAGLDKAARDAEHFGLVLTQTQRNSLLQYDDALDNLSLALEGFKKQVAAAFAPSLTKTIEFMTSAVSYAKTIFTEFANAAEKLFIRFGALAATIELVGKQIFSLNVLNKESWQLTIDQISAIDQWAAKEIKAVDAVKNTAVEMEATKTKTKEYTVSQQKLGEAIVAATQIMLKQQDALGQQQQRLGQGIVDTSKLEYKIRGDESKKFFTQLFADEEEAARLRYLNGPDMNFMTSDKRQEATGKSINDQLEVRNRLAQEEVDIMMAKEAEMTTQIAQMVEADRKNEEYQGKFLLGQEQKRQAMQFTWKDAFGQMSQSASFAFGQIRNNFGQTVADLVQGTANWKQFWQNTQSALINSFVQFGIEMVAQYVTKNAMILATEGATALGVTSIWTATSAAVIGAFGTMTGAISLFFTGTLLPLFATVGEIVMTFLGSIATALDISIFGAPFSIPIWAAVGLVAAAVGVISAFAFGAFAEGGLVKGPMMGLVGEAGPELIVPLSKLGQMGMGGGPITINVRLDGKTLARSSFDNMPGVFNIRGVRA